VDPHSVLVGAPPADGRDLAISARNSWVMALDNVTEIPGWLSDALCRLATGGGYKTRQLYTDTDEVLINVQRPIIVNAIGDPIEQEDLRDRSLFLTLPTITIEQRQTEAEFEVAFDRAAPGLVGALL